MAQHWREFEKFVARVEAAISPNGAIVTSPDYVLDLVTGEPREVDASIRLDRESPPVKVIECRDRAKVEDVMWVEQLITKCQDHGIPTVAVSSAGFTKPAVEKAKSYGIEARRMSELTQEEMIDWVKINRITHVVYFSDLATVNLELYGQPGETNMTLHPAVISQIQDKPGDAAVIVRRADGQGFRAGQMLDMALDNGLKLFDDVPTDGTKIHKQAVLRFPKGYYCVQTIAGPRDLSKLILGVNVHGQESVVEDPNTGHCYSGTGRPTVNGIEAEGDVLGNPVLVSFNKQVDSDVLRIMVTDLGREPSRTPKPSSGKRSKKASRSRRH
jgi:hypothetical protein